MSWHLAIPNETPQTFIPQRFPPSTKVISTLFLPLWIGQKFDGGNFLDLRTWKPLRMTVIKTHSYKSCYTYSHGHLKSVEPKVRLQGYGYNPFCSHSSCCLEVLVWQYFEEAFCAPKVRLKWYGFKGFPSHSSHCSGGLFPQYSGSAHKILLLGGDMTKSIQENKDLLHICAWSSEKKAWHLFAQRSSPELVRVVCKDLSGTKMLLFINCKCLRFSCVPSWRRCDLLGPVLFFADFYFWAAGLFCGFCLEGFLLIFVGKSAQKILQENPGKILQNLYNKNPRHISSEGPCQDF